MSKNIVVNKNKEVKTKYCYSCETCGISGCKDNAVDAWGEIRECAKKDHDYNTWEETCEEN